MAHIRCGASVMMCLLGDITGRVRARCFESRACLAHQPQHPLALDLYAVQRPQPSPQLAMALAGPGRAREVSPDRRQLVLVGDRRLRTAACWASPSPCYHPRLPVAPRRTRILGTSQTLADPRDTVAAAGACAGRVRHYRNLLPPKSPYRSIFARIRSFALLSSPIRCMAAASWPSPGCAVFTCSPAAWPDAPRRIRANQTRLSSNRARATVILGPVSP